MNIRQEYEETLEFLAKKRGAEVITIPLTLSATEWRYLFHEMDVDRRLKLLAAVKQCRMQEEALSSPQEKPSLPPDQPIPNWGWCD